MLNRKKLLLQKLYLSLGITLLLLSAIHLVSKAQMIEGKHSIESVLVYAIQVYDGTSYTGTWCYSDSPTVANIHSSCDNKTSSLLLKPGWSVRLYRDPNQNGPSKCFTASDPNFDDDVYDDGSPLDNSVSSFVLRQQTTCPDYIPTPQYALQVYDGINHTGTWCYSDSPTVANIHSSCDNKTSSLLLKSGWSVRLYRDPNQNGPSKCFTASDPDFSDDTYSDGTPLDNSVSSFTLYQQSDCLEILTYSIAGKITDAKNNPLQDVTVTLPSGISTTTDDRGIYTISGLTSGIYEIIASKSNYNFWPSKQKVQVGPDAIDQDFTEWVCAKNIPLYLQGQPSTPKTLPNPTWYSEVYGNYPSGDTYNTIGRWGCKTSSEAMMISYFGSQYQPPFDTTPSILNTWLRGNHGYDMDNGVIPSRVLSYTWKNGVNLYLWDSVSGIDNQSLDDNLCSGRPAILKVKNPYGDHFVVATGKITVDGQSTYTINDPAHGQTTLRQQYNNSYVRADYYILGPTVFDRSMLEVTAHSPVHLLISDPIGRKLGYDPRTDTLWDEIPNAGYDMEAIGDSEGNVLPEVKILFIRQPLVGQYSLQVIGYDNGFYEIKTYETNSTGNISEENFSGEAHLNSADEHTVKVGAVIYLPVVAK